MLELVAAGLGPIVDQTFSKAYGATWVETVRSETTAATGKALPANNTDPQFLLNAMWHHWNQTLGRILGPAERNYVAELRDTRNRWAHLDANKPFGADDVYRAYDTAERLLKAVSAPEADELTRLKLQVLREGYDQATKQEVRKVAATATITGTPVAGLSPWRSLIDPHPDVAAGRYQQAEFAADLAQVLRGEASSEYQVPTEFFSRTYLTEGLRLLLETALLRLTGTGGEPVVELQTNFGGGKTHSMLALYHLFGGTTAGSLAGIEAVMQEASVNQLPEGVRRVVLVGTKISPGQPICKPDGTVVRTLWGELAYQLGGQEGYALVAEADQTATNPGDTLRTLLNRYAPCLILIDEWVRYACQLHDSNDLPGGSFDTHFTFAQTLTEAAKAADRALLVVSIPASEIEKGGERGSSALERLKNAVGRVDAPWRPASAEEGFEIVRRRLFQPIPTENFVARDTAVRAFTEMYRNNTAEFPMGCQESDYERRMRAAYPIHPELFDRLYQDWSSLDKFQRTRGVLRLMAAVIHELWTRQDPNLLILPATVPIDAAPVQFEMTRYLDDNWTPIIEKDVDGPHSLPLQIDGENPNLGRYSACRRVARTLYIGSAPTLRMSHRGLEDRQIRLGCAQPGESVAIFGDALRRLTDQATHLYVDGKRYWYSTQPSVTRLAQDRAAQQSEETVEEEIVRRLKEEQKNRGDFMAVHVAPPSPTDVPDEKETRLVILNPPQSHSRNAPTSAARVAAANLLEHRGLGRRFYQNTLVFLAPDQERVKELQQAVRQYLAWQSIENDSSTLNLDPFQTRQVTTKRDQSNDVVKQRLPETYCWLLVPGQSEPNKPIEWQELRLQGQDGLAVRAGKRLKTEEMLITQWAGTLLRYELDRIPLWRGDHVEVKQLVEDFARYPYLPRLQDSRVLISAIVNGVASLTWQQDTFAFADDWDETRQRYRNLCHTQNVLLPSEGRGLLVKPEFAQIQIEIEAKPSQPTPSLYIPTAPSNIGGVSNSQSGSLFGALTVGEDEQSDPRRFHGTVKLDSVRLSRDVGNIAQEVIQHLAGLMGANVEIVLEIRADVPDGVPESVARTVTENCRTLNFQNYGFETD